MIAPSRPTYIGLRTYRLKPETTRCSVGAIGMGVPPALTNSVNADIGGGSPGGIKTAPTTRAAAQPGSGWLNRHPVINHGISPTTVPGATTKNPALRTAAFDL